MANAEVMRGMAPITEAPRTEKRGFFTRVADRMKAGQMAKAERIIKDVTGKPAAEVRADMARKIRAAR